MVVIDNDQCFGLILQESTSGHSGVSRTISDTLSAEFAEYVTIQGSPPTDSPGTKCSEHIE